MKINPRAARTVTGMSGAGVGVGGAGVRVASSLVV